MSELEKVLLYGVLYPGTVVPLLYVVFLAFRGRVGPIWLKPAFALGVLLSAVRLYFLSLSPAWGVDHAIFRRVGIDILDGLNPYAAERFWGHPFLNPPTTLPLFAAFAIPDAGLSLLLWSAINSVIALALVFLAHRVLVTLDGETIPEPSWYELGSLSAVVAISDASTATIQLGQLSLFATLLILCALDAQAKRRPILAGACLGFATMKISTMMPFFILFHSKTDRPTWVALGLTVLFLCMVTGHPERLPAQCRSLVHYISDLSKPSAVNDISYDGPQNESIVGFDHAFFRLGLRGRTALAISQWAAIGLLGTWLAKQVWRETIPMGLSGSLVSLFSVLFLYHRVYDSVIFAFPLTYALGRAKSSHGWPRRLFAASVIAMLVVMYMRRRTLLSLTQLAPTWGFAGRLIQALILPYATWLTLAGMTLLWLGAQVSHEAPSQTGET